MRCGSTQRVARYCGAAIEGRSEIRSGGGLSLGAVSWLAANMLDRVRAVSTIAIAAVCVGAAVSGCHVNVEAGTSTRSANPTTTAAAAVAGPAVPKGDVEQITGQLIRDKSGGGPYVVTCPNDLPIKLGASMQCVVADQNGARHELTVTITKADAPNDATWDWEVGPEVSAE
ncbi:hypothetical protein B7435_07345 [Mycolicibacterium peregrinum]|nr:hypothetical protein B7435_07345 [Mycolicibacterium peregrinum]